MAGHDERWPFAGGLQQRVQRLDGFDAGLRRRRAFAAAETLPIVGAYAGEWAIGPATSRQVAALLPAPASRTTIGAPAARSPSQRMCSFTPAASTSRSLGAATATANHAAARTGIMCPPSTHAFNGDRILEALGVEAVERAFGGFSLRIHEVGERLARRAAQLDVVREIVGDPVH